MLQISFHQLLQISYCLIQRCGSIWTDIIDPYSIRKLIPPLYWSSVAHKLKECYWLYRTSTSTVVCCDYSIYRYPVFLFLIGCSTKCICIKKLHFIRQMFPAEPHVDLLQLLWGVVKRINFFGTRADTKYNNNEFVAMVTHDCGPMRWSHNVFGRHLNLE